MASRKQRKQRHHQRVQHARKATHTAATSEPGLRQLLGGLLGAADDELVELMPGVWAKAVPEPSDEAPSEPLAEEARSFTLDDGRKLSELWTKGDADWHNANARGDAERFETAMFAQRSMAREQAAQLVGDEWRPPLATAMLDEGFLTWVEATDVWDAPGGWMHDEGFVAHVRSLRPWFFAATAHIWTTRERGATLYAPPPTALSAQWRESVFIVARADSGREQALTADVTRDNGKVTLGEWGTVALGEPNRQWLRSLVPARTTARTVCGDTLRQQLTTRRGGAG